MGVPYDLHTKCSPSPVSAYDMYGLLCLSSIDTQRTTNNIE